MTNEELIRAKVLEAYRLLAETFVLFSTPPPVMPQLTLWVNDEDPDRMCAYDSELKKSQPPMRLKRRGSERQERDKKGKNGKKASHF